MYIKLLLVHTVFQLKNKHFQLKDVNLFYYRLIYKII